MNLLPQVGKLYKSIFIKHFAYKNNEDKRIQGEYKSGSIFLCIKFNEKRSFFLDLDGDILEEDTESVTRWLREVEV